MFLKRHLGWVVGGLLAGWSLNSGCSSQLVAPCGHTVEEHRRSYPIKAEQAKQETKEEQNKP